MFAEARRRTQEHDDAVRARLSALAEAAAQGAHASVRAGPDAAVPREVETVVADANVVTTSEHAGRTRPRIGRLVELWLPAGAKDGKLGRRGAWALGLVAVLAAVAAGVGVWLGRPVLEPAPMLPLAASTTWGGRSAEERAAPVAPSAGGAGTADGVSDDHIVVSVVGRVAQPGLVTLKTGSRVADALRAAGGADQGVDLTTLNLARRLADGEQVAVGVPPAPQADSAASAEGNATSAPVDLNTATVAQLDALPGIGAVTAQHIVQWRIRHGRFTRIDQLREVGGIGDSRLAKLKGLLRI